MSFWLTADILKAFGTDIVLSNNREYRTPHKIAVVLTNGTSRDSAYLTSFLSNTFMIPTTSGII